MSRRRDLEANLRSLAEIGDILNAMKNMARMEVHRLGRFLDTQRNVVRSMEAAAIDFRQFHPALFQAEGTRDVFIVLGSERGFCGDFNTSLMQAFEGRHAQQPAAGTVVVGSKLHSKMADLLPGAVFLESASVAEEIEDTLIRIMDAVSRDGAESAAPLRLTVFHHPAPGGASVSVLSPFEQPDAPDPAFTYPPALFLDPPVFARELMQQYLFARLHELLYASLLAENQARMEHLEAAVQRLERKSTELFRKRNVLRQEEITEEIEVIMLSAEIFG